MSLEQQSVKYPAEYSVKLRGRYEPMSAAEPQKGAKMAELTYTKNGDYLIPNIELEETTNRPLGKYGRMRRAYLQENNMLLYNHLILTGKLFPHLLEIQDAAESRMEQMMEALLKANPAPDKKTRQLDWVRHMNSLRAQAEEVILAELINN